MTLDTALLRALHVLAAALWTGMAFYQVTIVLPALRADPQAGGPFMRRVLLQGKLNLWLAIVSSTTVLAGLLLYWRAGIYEVPADTTYGMLLNLAVLLALVAYGIAMLVGRPTIKKMLAAVHGNAPPDPAKMGPLQARMGKVAHTVLSLLVVTLLLMVLAGRI